MIFKSHLWSLTMILFDAACALYYGSSIITN